MADKPRIGIVGLGDIGMMHLRGFELLEERCEIGALCEFSPRRIELAKNKLSHSTPEIYSDYKHMLAKADIDVVVVGIPNYLHKDAAIAALQAGKDVFLEKPVAHNMEACDEIIKALHNTDRILQIGLVYRYSNLYRTLARMTERGDFGQVTMAYCKEYRDNFGIPWFFYKDESGGALLDKNCHHFDLFSWFIGARPVRVQAMGGRHVVKGKGYKIKCSYSRDPGQIIDDPDIVDHAFVNVEYENSAVASLGLCMYELDPIEGLQIGLMGANGAHAVATRDAELMIGGGPLGEMREAPVDYVNDNMGIGHIGCHIEHIEFLDCIRDRKEPYAQIFTGRDSMTVCFAAQRSIDERRDVFIEEFRNEEIEAIRSERERRWRKSTPDPLPPPERTGHDSRAVMLNLLLDLARLMLGGKEKRPRPQQPLKLGNPLEKLRNISNAFSRYKNASRGLKTKVGFTAPGLPLMVIGFDNGRIFPASGQPEVTLKFSEEGLRKALGGESVQKLLLSGKMTVQGEYTHLLPYTDAFFILFDGLRS